MEMDETPLERLFPWPRINGPCFPLHQLRSLLRMRRKALRPVVVLFEPVLMVGIQYHLNGLGGKRSLLSTLPHLIYLFCWKIIMCKVSKSKLATICKKVKCWTRKHLKIFTFFCTFSHLLDKSKNSTHVWKQNLNELTSHQHQPQHWQTSPHYLPDEFTLATSQVCWFSSPIKLDWVVGRRNMSDRMDEFLIWQVAAKISVEKQGKPFFGQFAAGIQKTTGSLCQAAPTQPCFR